MPDIYVEDWTTPIDYQLKKNGQPFDRTGMTLSMTFRDKNGVAFVPAGTIAWTGAVADSIARFTPAAGDLTFARSPIGVHYNVVAPDGAASFPKGHAVEWVISRRGGRP